jgi:hypothetical protein
MAGTEQLTRNGQANGNSATVSGPGNKHNPTNSPKY